MMPIKIKLCFIFFVHLFSFSVKSSPSLGVSDFKVFKVSIFRPPSKSFKYWVNKFPDISKFRFKKLYILQGLYNVNGSHLLSKNGTSFKLFSIRDNKFFKFIVDRVNGDSIVIKSLEKEEIDLKGFSPIFFNKEMPHVKLAPPNFDLSKIPGENEHQLSLALDLNGDGITDFLKITHYCKNEKSPYPLSRKKLEKAKFDIDYTCNNIYILIKNIWIKRERETPL